MKKQINIGDILVCIYGDVIPQNWFSSEHEILVDTKRPFVAFNRRCVAIHLDERLDAVVVQFDCGSQKRFSTSHLNRVPSLQLLAEAATED